jgi:amino acid transporter
MSEKEKQSVYPVKTAHEFFSEINKEWGRFKRGTTLSIFICSILLLGFVSAFLRITAIHHFEVGGLLLLSIVGFLVYTIYLMVSQYRFFRRWEKRMEHVYSYEEKLLTDDSEANEVDKQTS